MACLVSPLFHNTQHKYEFVHESSCMPLKMSSELIFRSWVSRSKVMNFFFLRLSMNTPVHLLEIQTHFLSLGHSFLSQLSAAFPPNAFI